MPLTDTAIRAAKPGTKPRKLSDGGGLYLLVTTSGSRLWRMNYRFAGKQKTLSFGGYPATTLAVARARRDQSKALLSAGDDPSAHMRLEKMARQSAAQNSFNAVADEYLAKQEREGRAAATLKKTSWLLDFARSDLGRRPIADLTAAEILTVLRKVEARGKLETARRLRSTIGSVFRYAIATARAENDPTFALRGALTTPTVKPRAAITDEPGFGALLRAIDAFDGQATTAAALKLLALLFSRPGELRAAEWSEFDFDERTWTIPAIRAKMRRAHCKPLSDQAVTILRDLAEHTGERKLIFPSLRGASRPMSENTLNAALRRMGYSCDEATAHGFRASASTLLNESGKWTADAIDRELGHQDSDSVRRAYARGEHFDERREMVQWWANYCESLKAGGTILQLRA